MDQQIVKKAVKHFFSMDEKMEISGQLSQAIMEKAEHENDLKMVQAQVKSRIAEAQAKISSSAAKLQSGFEMRQTDCRVVYDFEHGIVRYMNMEIEPEVEVDARLMTREERQIRLPLDPPVPLVVETATPPPEDAI